MAIYILGPDSNGDCCTCAERVNVCDTCSPVTGSCCALYLPPPTASVSPYSTLTGAQYAVANQVNNCIGFIDRLTGVNSFTAAQAAGQLTLGVSVTYTEEPSSSTYPRLWGSIALAAGNVVSVSSTQPAFSYLYDCDGNLLDTVLTNGSFVAAPSDAGYMLEVFPQWPSVAGSFSLTVTFSNANLIVNPVIALWDDSGTTRQLEACPKMLLPPLTESSSNWYANQTAAQTAITNLTSNCVGCCEDFTSFTATDGGTSLTFAGYRSGGGGFNCYGSINAVAGATVTFTFTGTTFQFVRIWDDEGVELFSDQNSAPITSSALPYTGRYIVQTTTYSPTASESVAITSSSTMSVNPIQALYDVGLDCPARLDC